MNTFDHLVCLQTNKGGHRHKPKIVNKKLEKLDQNNSNDNSKGFQVF